MRRRFVRFGLAAALAMAWVASAGAYVQRALACADMVNDPARASCCANAKRDRFNGENGDCCRDLRWIEGEQVAPRVSDPPPVAFFAVLPARVVSLAIVSPSVRAEPVTDAPERPPPLEASLGSTVLLI